MLRKLVRKIRKPLRIKLLIQHGALLQALAKEARGHQLRELFEAETLEVCVRLSKATGTPHRVFWGDNVIRKRVQKTPHSKVRWTNVTSVAQAIKEHHPEAWAAIDRRQLF